MTVPVLRLDFVSDIACPWCAIGLASLQQALDNLAGTVAVDLHLQPFELNPDLEPQGEDAAEHIMRKYGIDKAKVGVNRAALQERAAAVGFAYNVGAGGRVWNTHDAHRLLHWAGLRDGDAALALKQALFRAYFTDNENVSDHTVLLRLVEEAGLDPEQARDVLASGEYSQAVRDQEQYYQQEGIHSVPATIVNQQYLISGGQPPEAFERALRNLAGEMTSPT